MTLFINLHRMQFNFVSSFSIIGCNLFVNHTNNRLKLRRPHQCVTPQIPAVHDPPPVVPDQGTKDFVLRMSRQQPYPSHTHFRQEHHAGPKRHHSYVATLIRPGYHCRVSTHTLELFVRFLALQTQSVLVHLKVEFFVFLTPPCFSDCLERGL